MDMENMENVEKVEVIEAPAAENVSKGKSIAALVCGILGLIGGWFPIVQYFTLVLSILGIIFGAKAKKLAVANGEPTGMATAGLVLGIISVALTILAIVCTVCAAGIVGLAAAGNLG